MRGKDTYYDYALAQEFGTQHIPAQPFFFRPTAPRKQSMRKAIMDEATDAIRQTGAAEMSVSDASLELQKAIVAALKADAGVDALVGTRIYDAVPMNATKPYVELWPVRSAAGSWRLHRWRAS